MRARARLTTAVAVVAGAVVGAVPPATADGAGYAWTDGQTLAAEAASTGAPQRPRRTRTAASPPVCTYERLSPERAATADALAAKGWESARGEGPGAWFRKVCTTGTGNSWADVIWIRARPEPDALAEQAADRVPIPTPGIAMNPPPDTPQVVHVPSWLWLEPDTWAPVNATASAGGVTATATATPDYVLWDMGNGDRVTCSGQAPPYDPSRPAAEQRSACTYTYRASSAKERGAVFIVTATAVWNLSWTASGAPGGGRLGTVRRSASVPVRVAEIQTLNQ